MKLIRLIAILIAALFCLSSCSTLAGGENEIITGGETPASSENGSPNDETTAEEFDFTLEPDRQDLPTLVVLSEIQEGMTKREVYEIAGSPQKMVMLPTSARPTTSLTFPGPWYVYHSADGGLVLLCFMGTTDDPIDRVKYVRRLQSEDDLP